MENKLQQLTEKLYNDGLAKGKTDAEAIIEKAKQEAKSIIDQANAQAKATNEKAQTDAKMLADSTKSEIKMAANQIVSALRQQVLEVVTTNVFEPQIKEAYKNGDFVKEIIVKAVEAFRTTSDEGVQVIAPEGFDEVVKDAVVSQLNGGVSFTTNSKVKVPFRVAPSDGSYVVSFSDEDFSELFKSYIRPIVSDLLYK